MKLNLIHILVTQLGMLQLQYFESGGKRKDDGGIFGEGSNVFKDKLVDKFHFSDKLLKNFNFNDIVAYFEVRKRIECVFFFQFF